MAALPEIQPQPNADNEPALYLVPDPWQETIEKRALQIVTGPEYLKIALQKRLDFLGRQNTKEPAQLEANSYQLNLFKAIHERVELLEN